MKLTEKALKAIHTPEIRRELSAIFNCTDQTIQRYIHKNQSLGPLTTAGALDIIKKETGLTDQEILEEDEPVHVGK